MLKPPLMATVHYVKIDDSLRIQLRDLREVTIVCGADGKPLGHFVPLAVPAEMLEPIRSSPYTADDLEAARQEAGGRPLSEILRSLGQTA
jgi:hypothetical protein